MEVAAASKAIAVLGGGEAQISVVHLPETDQAHYLVVIPKIQPTGERYPRRPGMPAKRPL
jgi:16S rRNA (guanine527-N7)-methyltransferase